MSKKFQKGARVTRTGKTFLNAIEGEDYTVAESGPFSIELAGLGNTKFDPREFELSTKAAKSAQYKPMLGESDPTGRPANAPGAKLDAGKVRPSLIIEGMPRALLAVSAVATFGANKYTPGGWLEVPNGESRYADAGYRHILKRAAGEVTDPDSEELHLAHEAWNALAKLELFLINKEKK